MSSIIKEARQQTTEQILHMIIALQQDILRQNRTESTEPSIDAENAPITSLLNAALNHSVTAENPNADTHATILLLIRQLRNNLNLQGGCLMSVTCLCYSLCSFCL